MAENILTGKLIDLNRLELFWDNAKKYIGDLDTAAVNEAKEYTNTKFNEVNNVLNGDGTDNNKGLVDAVATLRTDVDALGGTDGGIQGMIDATIADLKLSETYDAIGAAATAKEEAIAHADGLAKNYDAAGSAADAEAAAKAHAESYADGLAKNYDAAGSAAAVLGTSTDTETTVTVYGVKAYVDSKDAAMDTRVKVLEAIDHDKLAADAASSAVATVVGGAPQAFNTLKEIADWIQKDAANENSFGAAARIEALETGKADKTYVDGLDNAIKERVKDLEDHKNDYVGADETVLASANTYAKAYANVLVYKIENTNDPTIETTWTPRFDIAGAATTAAATAKSEAITHANSAAATAETNANNYTDGKLASILIATDDDIKGLFD